MSFIICMRHLPLQERVRPVTAPIAWKMSRAKLILRALRPAAFSSAQPAAAAPARGFASSASANGIPVEVHNEKGDKRVVVTKELPGDRWLKILTQANCRVEVCE